MNLPRFYRAQTGGTPESPRKPGLFTFIRALVGAHAGLYRGGMSPVSGD